MVAHPDTEDVEGISPHVREEEIPQELLHERLGSHQPERTSPQKPVITSSQKETGTLNILVNDRSSVGAYTLDMIAPPTLTSEVYQMKMVGSE